MKNVVLTLAFLFGTAAQAEVTLLKGLICENAKYNLVIKVEADQQAHDMATVSWTLFPKSGSALSQKYMGYLFADGNSLNQFSSTDQGSDLTVDENSASVALSNRRRPVEFTNCSVTQP